MFSFNITAAGKTEALHQVEQRLQAAAEQDALHLVDHGVALSTAAAYLEALPDRGDMDITVAMSGQVTLSAEQVQSLNLNIQVGLVGRTA